MKNFGINITDNYPKIITPDYLTILSNKNVQFEEIYPHIKKPTYKSKEIDKNELEIVGSGLGCGCLTFFCIGLFCLILANIFNVSGENWKTYWFPTILVIGIIVGILITVLVLLGKTKEVQIKKTENVENYKKYLSELEKYKNLQKSVSSNDFQARQKQKNCIYQSEINRKSIFKALQILNDGEVKKGITEEFYHKFLVTYSDFKVYKSIKFSFYYPDLILTKSDLVIALEIDEPYSFDSKEPIHYESVDKTRDNYFVKSGFILIRFTENQIVSFPEKCLEVINDVVKSCLSLSKYNKSKTHLFIEEKILSYDEAFDLAYNNSRKDIVTKISTLTVKYF